MDLIKLFTFGALLLVIILFLIVIILVVYLWELFIYEIPHIISIHEKRKKKDNIKQEKNELEKEYWKEQNNLEEPLYNYEEKIADNFLNRDSLKKKNNKEKMPLSNVIDFDEEEYSKEILQFKENDLPKDKPKNINIKISCDPNKMYRLGIILNFQQNLDGKLCIYYKSEEDYFVKPEESTINEKEYKFCGIEACFTLNCSIDSSNTYIIKSVEKPCIMFKKGENYFVKEKGILLIERMND